MLPLIRCLSCLLLAAALLFALPTGDAQSDAASLRDWIPAGFDGFIQLDTSNPSRTLQTINQGMLTAAALQPTRVDLNAALTYNDLFPLDLFDLEDASFDAQIAPWLGDSLIVAYQQLDALITSRADQRLLILAPEDAFAAAAALNRVLEGQDLLQHATYRGQTIYAADRTAIALTPLAILIGPESLIEAALDAQAGAAARLTDDDAYAAVADALDDGAALFAYVHGQPAAGALSALLGADAEGGALLAAAGETIAWLNEVESLESQLLRGTADAVGVAVYPQRIGSNLLRADVALHGLDAAATYREPSTRTVQWIPRSAALVHNGASGAQGLTSALAALPLLNFAPQVLGALPLPSAQSGPTVLPSAPTSAALQTAVESFFDVIAATTGLDLTTDVISAFNGDYSLAVLPRPNNPTPVLSTPYDLLLVARVGDAAVIESLRALLETYLPQANIALESIDDRPFLTLRPLPGPGVSPDDDPVLRIGVIGEVLLAGTGSAIDLALHAGRGDNRLIDQARWTALNGDDQAVSLYVDITAYYNTFFPTAGGTSAGPVRQFSVSGGWLDSGIFRWQAQAALDS